MLCILIITQWNKYGCKTGLIILIAATANCTDTLTTQRDDSYLIEQIPQSGSFLQKPVNNPGFLLVGRINLF
jgi:hypothetical protein